MADGILGLKKYKRGEQIRQRVLLLYDIPLAVRKTDPDGNPIVLSPSSSLPPEADLGTSPITQAEKDEFDAGTMCFLIHDFGLKAEWVDDTEMIATARDGWAARQSELLANYNQMADDFEYTGIRITPA